MPRSSEFLAATNPSPDDADDLAFVPTDTIAASTVQDAIEELEADVVSMNDMPDLSTWFQNQII
jgi:hypothetical protein